MMGWATATGSRPVPSAAPTAASRRVWRAASVALAAAVSAGSQLTGTALAYWPGLAGEGSGKVVLGSLAAPPITSATPGGEAASLTWSAVTAPGSGTVEYYVTRDGGSPAGTCPSKTAPSTA